MHMQNAFLLQSNLMQRVSMLSILIKETTYSKYQNKNWQWEFVFFHKDPC